MLHIDQDIFEEIVRYEEGGLEGAERNALAQKLLTDEVYRRHLAYYQIVVRAIGRAGLAAKIDRMQGHDLSPEDSAAVDNLLTHDRRMATWRKAGYLTVLAFVVAGAAFWVGRATAPAPECPPVAPQVIEEPEFPVAASGDDRLLVVPFTDMVQSERQIAWQTHGGTELEYRFQQGNLKLLVPRQAEADFLNNRPAWITRKAHGETIHVIKYKDRLFRLTPSNVQRQLTPVQDETILNLLE